LATGTGILKVTRDLHVGVGTVRRVKRDMDAVAA
jgi:hypothetical protein